MGDSGAMVSVWVLQYLYFLLGGNGTKLRLMLQSLFSGCSLVVISLHMPSHIGIKIL